MPRITHQLALDPPPPKTARRHNRNDNTGEVMTTLRRPQRASARWDHRDRSTSDGRSAEDEASPEPAARPTARAAMARSPNCCSSRVARRNFVRTSSARRSILSTSARVSSTTSVYLDSMHTARDAQLRFAMTVPCASPVWQRHRPAYACARPVWQRHTPCVHVCASRVAVLHALRTRVRIPHSSATRPAYTCAHPV